MKRQSTEVFAHVSSSSAEGWDYAIVEASRQIQEAEEKVRQLRLAIQTFQEMRETGEPWPGASGSEDRLLGQK